MIPLYHDPHFTSISEWIHAPPGASRGATANFRPADPQNSRARARDGPEPPGMMLEGGRGRIWPSIHPSIDVRLINPNLYRSRSNRIHLSIIDLSPDDDTWR